MKNIKLKICGMKHNTSEVLALEPDFMGFIFYDRSPRFHENRTPNLSENIKKVGVFVDESLAYVSEKIDTEKLDIIQLHGNESPDYCRELKQKYPTKEIWKVFKAREEFDFSQLEPYEEVADKYLFDTLAQKPGGTGLSFNWEVLRDYPSQKEFILSGGIGPYEIEKLCAIIETNLPIYAIDVNSKFEIEPGLKDIQKLSDFIKKLKTEDCLRLNN